MDRVILLRYLLSRFHIDDAEGNALSSAKPFHRLFRLKFAEAIPIQNAWDGLAVGFIGLNGTDQHKLFKTSVLTAEIPA
jgi:hypothetical protein